MSQNLSLTDGFTTVLLNHEYNESGEITVASSLQILGDSYRMQTPQPSLPFSGAGSGDYGLTPWQYQDVTETIEMLGKDQPSDLGEIVRSIEGLLDRARERQNTGMGPRVYLQRKLTTDEGETWRCEVLSGRLSYPNMPEDLRQVNRRVSLSLTRRYFWEGEETQLTLTSSEDSGATTVDAYNNDDFTPTATNYVLFGLSTTPGVVPAPVRIHITNDAGESVSWREIFLTNWVADTSTVVDPFLLGAEADSGASYSLTTTEALGWRWSPGVLTDARLTQLEGRRYRILVAFGSGSDTTGVYLRATIEAYVSGTAIAMYQGPLVAYAGEGLIDLGALPIPPGGYDLLGSDISLKITAFRPAGAATMAVDFVQLTPAGEGQYQRLVQIGFAAANGATVVSDGIENISYYDDAGRHRPIIRQRGAPILLFPNRYNRLRVLYREASGFTPGRRFEVKVYYRPRRLSL